MLRVEYKILVAYINVVGRIEATLDEGRKNQDMSDRGKGNQKYSGSKKDASSALAEGVSASEGQNIAKWRPHQCYWWAICYLPQLGKTGPY